MTAIGIAIVGAGVLLVGSGIKDLDPRAVVLALLTGKPMPAKGDTYESPGTAAPRTRPGGPRLVTGRVGGIVGVPLPPSPDAPGGGGGGSGDHGGW